MQRTLWWGALFALWLLTGLGSLLTLFVEFTDGSALGPASTVAGVALLVWASAIVGYRFGVPPQSRPSARAWLVAVVGCLGLAGVVGGLLLLSALGVIRG
jgi:hypothetical protein